ncbi:MAG: DUF3649 domain-containing protein [Pseudomonadota bacterium]
MSTPAVMAKRPGRWHIASRVFAATIPGFVLTNTSGVLLSFLLPGEKLSGVAIATLLSFAIYAAIVMWIFSVKRLRTVWLGLLTGILLTGGGAWLLYTLEAAV